MSVNDKMTAIADAIREKTGETGTLTLDAMAELISALEVGGGITDYQGFPAVTGTITFAEDVTSDYTLTFPVGKRLRVKGNGYAKKPYFVMTLKRDNNSSIDTYELRYIAQLSYTTDNGQSPTPYAFICKSGSETLNTTNFMYTRLTWTPSSEFPNINDYTQGHDITYESVVIPCSSSMKILAGNEYKYAVTAPWSSDETEVEVV